MDTITLTNKQARQFILLNQGLIGDYKFIREEGILQYVRQAGCIQYDPIDVCGKNSELVLQSRVKGFTKKMLYKLLYEDRVLVDYFDKNLAIIPAENWCYYERIREWHRHNSRSFESISPVTEHIIQVIKEKGAIRSRDLEINDKVDWSWNSTLLSRAALETLYHRGDLIIHHKSGAFKYYALAEDHLPKQILETQDPYPDIKDHLKWRVLNRISAIGLLWNKPSDAWLGIGQLKSSNRENVFAELLEEKKILEIHVEGQKHPLYCLTGKRPLLKEVLQKNYLPQARMELIAPLDNMIWDRKLIQALFGFSYKWEIYTPVIQRKYGYYVLPILSGDRFIGRTEIVCDKKNDTLTIKAVWFEPEVKVTKSLKKALHGCFVKFMEFHGLHLLNNSAEMSSH